MESTYIITVKKDSNLKKEQAKIWSYISVCSFAYFGLYSRKGRIRKFISAIGRYKPKILEMAILAKIFSTKKFLVVIKVLWRPSFMKIVKISSCRGCRMGTDGSTDVQTIARDRI